MRAIADVDACHGCSATRHPVDRPRCPPHRATGIEGLQATCHAKTGNLFGGLPCLSCSDAPGRVINVRRLECAPACPKATYTLEASRSAQTCAERERTDNAAQRKWERIPPRRCVGKYVALPRRMVQMVHSAGKLQKSLSGSDRDAQARTAGRRVGRADVGLPRCH